MGGRGGVGSSASMLPRTLFFSSFMVGKLSREQGLALGNSDVSFIMCGRGPSH
jgi:hypothetical protein